MRRWYQNIEIGTEFEDKGRLKSKFWNKGKWDTFIKPLLPSVRNTFIEIGCNAGLFLKLATDVGFGQVVGVDSSHSILKQAIAYKESNGYDYKLIEGIVGQGLDLDALPVSDVVLIANTLHHIFFTLILPNNSICKASTALSILFIRSSVVLALLPSCVISLFI